MHGLKAELAIHTVPYEKLLVKKLYLFKVPLHIIAINIMNGDLLKPCHFSVNQQIKFISWYTACRGFLVERNWS